MEKNQITGKITAMLEPRSGVSKNGNQWKLQEFVIEETEGQYPQRMCFEVFGEENLSKFNLKVGEEVTVYFNVNCNEYKGKYYNQLRGWSVQKRGAGQQNEGYQQPQDTTVSQPALTPTDDLPF